VEKLQIFQKIRVFEKYTSKIKQDKFLVKTIEYTLAKGEKKERKKRKNKL